MQEMINATRAGTADMQCLKVELNYFSSEFFLRWLSSKFAGLTELCILSF